MWKHSIERTTTGCTERSFVLDRQALGDGKKFGVLNGREGKFIDGEPKTRGAFKAVHVSAFRSNHLNAGQHFDQKPFVILVLW